MTKTASDSRTPVLKHLKVPRLDLVGTAEAAAILNVERPRIGRWKKTGVMPPTVADLQAGPVWRRRDIERMVPYVTAIRRDTAPAPAKPTAKKKAAKK